VATTRDELLDAAARLFAERGIEAVPIAEIVLAAGHATPPRCTGTSAVVTRCSSRCWNTAPTSAAGGSSCSARNEVFVRRKSVYFAP
jgi:hypothetical protein